MTERADRIIAALEQRINHLEENRRFFQNALEMVLSLGDFSNTLQGDNEEKPYLKAAAERIEKIVSRVAIDQIRRGRAADEPERIRRLAHRIEGGAATVEAAPLSRAAAELEKLCSRNDRAAIPAAVDRLAIVFEEFIRYVTTQSGPVTVQEG